MKKRIIAGALCAVVLLAAGCGGSEAGADWKPAAASYEINGSDYVTLCDYSAILVTITGNYVVDDDDLQEYLAEYLAPYLYYGPFHVTDATRTVVGDGDIINVDYVGTLDGVAFQGGSATSQLIDVDNNCSVADLSNDYRPSSYIAGFTDGLKGAHVGDVVACDVTFPENYGNEDLAGKDVVFTFTINAIVREVNSVDDVDDTFAQEIFGVDTADEIYASIRDMLEAQAEDARLNNIVTEIQQYLLDNCTVELPKNFVEARYDDYRHWFIERYCDGDESELESYFDYYGKSVAEMEETWRDSVERTVRMELIMDAIAQELGIEMDEADYAGYTEQAMAQEGCSTQDELYELYGYGDAEYGERYFRDIYRYNVALEKIADTAVVNEAAE